MTVILDPGTAAGQTESYNASSRPWRTSSGLWKADYTAAEAARVTAVGNYNTAEAARVTAVALAATYLANYNAVVPPAAPIEVSTGMTATGTFDRGLWTTAGGNWTAPRSGYYAVFAEARAKNPNNPSIDQFGSIRILNNGSNQLESAQSRIQSDGNNGTEASKVSTFGTTFVTSGQNLQVQVRHDGGNPGLQRSFDNIVLKTTFVPVTSYAH